MSQPPRIAYLVSQYPATNHTFILREIFGLRGLGLEPGVISIRPADRAPQQMTPVECAEARATFYVKDAGVWGFLAAHARTLTRSPLRYVTGLTQAVKLSGFAPRRLAFHLAYFAEAVVAGNWMYLNGFRHLHSHFSSTVAMLVGATFPITWSATLHGPDEFSDPTGFHLKEKCRSSLFLVAISEHGRDHLSRFAEPEDRRRITVCRLGVDPSLFSPAPFRPHPERFELLCVGRLAPVKSHSTLLAAIGILTAQGRALRLRIAGDGPLRASLQAEITARKLDSVVSLEGALNQDRLLPLYAAADIFVLPSLAEGVPVVLMEAMAMEIACVATAVNGVPELIRDEGEGLLVNPSDPDSLAKAIARLMDSSLLRRQLAAAGRQRVLEVYDIERNINALRDIFEKCL